MHQCASYPKDQRSCFTNKCFLTFYIHWQLFYYALPKQLFLLYLHFLHFYFSKDGQSKINQADIVSCNAQEREYKNIFNTEEGGGCRYYRTLLSFFSKYEHFGLSTFRLRFTQHMRTFTQLRAASLMKITVNT